MSPKLRFHSLNRVGPSGFLPRLWSKRSGAYRCLKAHLGFDSLPSGTEALYVLYYRDSSQILGSSLQLVHLLMRRFPLLYRCRYAHLLVLDFRSSPFIRVAIAPSFFNTSARGLPRLTAPCLSTFVLSLGRAWKNDSLKRSIAQLRVGTTGKAGFPIPFIMSYFPRPESGFNTNSSGLLSQSIPSRPESNLSLLRKKESMFVFLKQGNREE